MARLRRQQSFADQIELLIFDPVSTTFDLIQNVGARHRSG
jgi:hypothetical protein